MGKYLGKDYIRNPDSIQNGVGELHVTSDSSTPVDVSNSLGYNSADVTSTIFNWNDVSGTNQVLQMNSVDIQYDYDGIKRHLVGWDPATSTVVFAVPVEEEAVQSGEFYSTPADLDVANITLYT